MAHNQRLTLSVVNGLLRIFKPSCLKQFDRRLVGAGDRRTYRVAFGINSVTIHHQLLQRRFAYPLTLKAFINHEVGQPKFMTFSKRRMLSKCFINHQIPHSQIVVEYGVKHFRFGALLVSLLKGFKGLEKSFLIVVHIHLHQAGKIFQLGWFNSDHVLNLFRGGKVDTAIIVVDIKSTQSGYVQILSINRSR